MWSAACGRVAASSKQGSLSRDRSSTAVNAIIRRGLRCHTARPAADVDLRASKSHVCAPCIIRANHSRSVAPRWYSSQTEASSTSVRPTSRHDPSFGKVSQNARADTTEDRSGPSRRRRVTRAGGTGARQETVSLDDLPRHALGPDGLPRTPLPAEEIAARPVSKKGSRSRVVKSKQAPEEAAIGVSGATGFSAEDRHDGGQEKPNADVHPRSNELGPDGQRWPPLALDVLANMARFPTCILLTRVGGFYESYFEQAPTLAGLLGIKLASRTWGGRTVPMAGFPIVQLEKYLKILVMDHRRLVAICDEFKDIHSSSTTTARSADGAPTATDEGTTPQRRRRMASSRAQSPFGPSPTSRLGLNETIAISRRVTRVVSPGTLIDEAFLDPFVSNWVLSVGRMGDAFGVAWLDVSTADFHTTICNDEQSLRDEVARIGPSEIVLEAGTFTRSNARAESSAAVEHSMGAAPEPPAIGNPFGRPAPFVLDDSPLWDAVDPAKIHVSFVAGATEQALDSNTATTAEDIAVANLTMHLRTRLIDVDIQDVEDLTGHNLGPDRRRRDQVMTIDASTLTALEINASMRKDEQSFNPLSTSLSTRGSLLSHVRRTVTKGGARLLAQWLTAPSTSLPLIHRRQAIVALFQHQHAYMTEDLRILLRRRAGDINRALQRIITSRNDEQDLLEVRDFSTLCSDLVAQLRTESEQYRKGVSSQSSSDVSNADGWAALEVVTQNFEDLSSLAERLGSSMDESVIDKRLRLQEDRARELQVDVLGEGARLASGDEEPLRTKQTGASSRRSSSSSIAEDDREEGLWGSPFEHLIRPSASPQLAALTREHTLLRRRAYKLENDLRARFSERLSLRYLLGQGYVVHVPDIRDGMQKMLTSLETEMSLAYKSKTTRTYYHEQFTKIGSRLGRVELELQEKEAVELQRLRLDVLVELGRLRRNAVMIHELDVLAGFATLAHELNLVRPTVHDGSELRIDGGRHIGVELALMHQQQQVTQHSGITSTEAAPLSRPFVANDVALGESSRLHLITGPNMGGKSTLLRMVAIIAILAQVGSFVPATACEIGVVDQVFSRIGAHDAIHADRSTFMVEMLEVAQFLRRSTHRSLVLCDEVGRGTDHQTGAALAHATAMHLVDDVRCKCLFATHLHDVGDMLRGVEGVDYFCTDLEQTESGDIIFSHKLRRGMNRESHGLAIARLANIPPSVLARATDTLAELRAADGLPSASRNGDENGNNGKQKR